MSAPSCSKILVRSDEVPTVIGDHLLSVAVTFAMTHALLNKYTDNKERLYWYRSCLGTPGL